MFYDMFPIPCVSMNKGIDTFSEKQYTLPLYEFLDETNQFI